MSERTADEWADSIKTCCAERGCGNDREAQLDVIRAAMAQAWRQALTEAEQICRKEQACWDIDHEGAEHFVCEALANRIRSRIAKEPKP